MSDYDDWHPERKGNAKAAFDKAAPQTRQSLLLEKMKAKAREAVLRQTREFVAKQIDANEAKRDRPQPVLKPKDLNLSKPAEIRAGVDAKRGVYQGETQKAQDQAKERAQQRIQNLLAHQHAAAQDKQRGDRER